MTDTLSAKADQPNQEPLVAVTTLVPTRVALEFQRRAVDLIEDLTAEDLDDVGGFVPLDARTAVARYPDVWKLPTWGREAPHLASSQRRRSATSSAE